MLWVVKIRTRAVVLAPLLDRGSGTRDRTEMVGSPQQAASRSDAGNLKAGLRKSAVRLLPSRSDDGVRRPEIDIESGSLSSTCVQSTDQPASSPVQFAGGPRDNRPDTHAQAVGGGSHLWNDVVEHLAARAADPAFGNSV